MTETLIYLAAAVAVVLVLAWLTPEHTPIAVSITAVGALLVVLAVARHGPQAITDVLDAIAKTIGR